MVKKPLKRRAKINLFLLVSSKVASSTGGKANYFHRDMIINKLFFPKKGDLMLKKSKKANAEPKVSNSPVTMVDRTIIGDQIYIEGTIRGEEDLLI
jgi:hypothetical protein